MSFVERSPGPRNEIVPVSLGGRLELDNFQVEPLVDYYVTTGTIYEKALEDGKAI